MKQSSNSKRHHRGRGGGGRRYGHGHGLASNYESNGPDVKIKGSASHVFERYQALARDAVASGDRIAAESYLQHAEHYQRIINAHLAAAAQQADADGQGRQNNGRGGPDGAGRPGEGGGEAVGDAARARGRGRGRVRSQDERGDEAADADPESSEPFTL